MRPTCRRPPPPLAREPTAMSGAVPCTDGRLWCSRAAAAAAVAGSLLPDQRRGITAATTSSCGTSPLSGQLVNSPRSTHSRAAQSVHVQLRNKSEWNPSTIVHNF